MPCRPPCSGLLSQNAIHLPFLYSTRTILRLPTCRQAHNSSENRRRHSPARLLDLARGGRPPRRRVAQIDSPKPCRETDLHPQSSNSTSSSRYLNTPNPLDPDLETNPYTYKPPIDNNDISPSPPLHSHSKGGWRAHSRSSTTTPIDPNSTITPVEQRIFDQIFRDIAQSSPPANTPKPDPSAFDSLKKSRHAPPVDVETILASALPHRGKDRSSSAVPDPHLAISRYPPSLRQAAKLASSYFLNREGKQPKGPTSNEEDALNETDTLAEAEFSSAVEKACTDERTAIEQELNEAAKTTDYAVWKVLEARVFPMIARLGLDETDPSTESQTARKPKKGKVQSDPLALDPPTSPSKTPSPSPAGPPIPPLAIVAPLYPSLLLTTLRLLTTHFPTSPLALSLLPRIKALGPTSYVLGATTSLYNTLLHLRWTVYSDLKSMATLLTEMRANGVVFDEGTLAVLERVVQDRRAVLGASGERGGQAWWKRRGTKREFWRVCGEEEEDYGGREGEGVQWLGEVRREVEARREAERMDLDGEGDEENETGDAAREEDRGDGEGAEESENEETGVRVPVML